MKVVGKLDVVYPIPQSMVEIAVVVSTKSYFVSSGFQVS